MAKFVPLVIVCICMSVTGPGGAVPTASVFDQKKYHFEVAENRPVSTIVGKVKITPTDRVYRLTLLGNDAFTIDSLGESILTTRELDFETRNKYVLLAQAIGNNSSTSSAAVVVDVTNVNESPVFYPSEYHFTVAGKHMLGSTVGNVLAIDRDMGQGGSITYSLVPPLHGFSINPVTGQLTVVGPLSRDVNFRGAVRATDDGTPRLSTQAALTITILPEEVATTRAPCANLSFDVRVLENTNAGTHILGLKSYLPPGDYVIRGGSAKFTLGPSFSLIVAGHLDVESQRFYDLMISKSDNPEVTVVNVRVVVLDVNDFPPMFFGILSPLRVPYTLAVGETVYRFVAWDGDDINSANSHVSYSLVSGDTETFAINKTSGQLMLTKNLLPTKVYPLRIRAADHGSPSLEGYTDIDIQPFHPSTGLPVFNSAFTGVSLPEGSPVGTMVYRATASSTIGGSIVYSILGSTAQQQFHINSSSGEVFTSVTFDRETTERSGLVIRATVQNEGPPYSTAKMINVEISDVNDNPPEFPFACSSAVVPRDALAGRIIYRPWAIDPDSDGHQQLVYSILPENEDAFVITKQPEIVLMKSAMDLQRSSYNLTIVVSDGVFEARTGLLVTVVDSDG